jgi:hypothetical protein
MANSEYNIRVITAVKFVEPAVDGVWSQDGGDMILIQKIPIKASTWKIEK